jgi:Zn-dependent metalloprotease
MSSSRTVRGKVELDSEQGVPRRYYDIEDPASDEDPRRIAEDFLARVADELGISPDLSGLQFQEVRSSILGKHVLYQQQQAGRPVTGAWARVDVDPAGRVFNVHTDLLPESTLDRARAATAEESSHAITEAEAVDRAQAATGASPEARLEVHGTEQVTLPIDGQPRPAWKVVLVGSRQPGEWKVYVDAATGDVLRVVKLLKDAHRAGVRSASGRDT